MTKLKNYEFRTNSNPSAADVDEALSVIYEFVTEESKSYERKCPLGYEELGFYVFNRVLNIMSKDGSGDWRVGVSLWLSDVRWKTAPSYLRNMVSTGFIDYTRSFYSEFRHRPVDTQESLYVFERPEPDEAVTSLEDVKELFHRLSTSERLSLYKKFALDKAAFSDEFRNWFDGVSSPTVVDVVSPYELTTNQLHDVKVGTLAFRLPSGVVYYNVEVSSKNKVLVLKPF